MKLQWWITPIQCLCKGCRRIARGNDESVIAFRHQENIGFEVKAGGDVFRDLMPRRDSHQIPDLAGQGAEFALAVSKKKGPTQISIGAAMPKECRQGTTCISGTKWRDCQIHKGVVSANPMPLATRLRRGSVVSNS